MARDEMGSERHGRRDAVDEEMYVDVTGRRSWVPAVAPVRPREREREPVRERDYEPVRAPVREDAEDDNCPRGGRDV